MRRWFRPHRFCRPNGLQQDGRPAEPLSRPADPAPMRDASLGRVSRPHTWRWERSMTRDGDEDVTFEATLRASGNNTGIPVPDDVIERLGQGKWPPVMVNVNGYEYRSTVAVMAGQY